MPAAGENKMHFEVVKIVFTRGNARRRRKKIGTLRSLKQDLQGEMPAAGEKKLAL
jgi:hypothetical protein